jgi:hypothetical protein
VLTNINIKDGILGLEKFSFATFLCIGKQLQLPFLGAFSAYTRFILRLSLNSDQFQTSAIFPLGDMEPNIKRIVLMDFIHRLVSQEQTKLRIKNYRQRSQYPRPQTNHTRVNY